MNKEQVKEADRLISRLSSIQSALLKPERLVIALEQEPDSIMRYHYGPSPLCPCPIEYLEAEAVKVKARITALGITL